MYSLEREAAKYRNLTIVINKAIEREYYAYNLETQEASIIAKTSRSARAMLEEVKTRTHNGAAWLQE